VLLEDQKATSVRRVRRLWILRMISVGERISNMGTRDNFKLIVLKEKIFNFVPQNSFSFRSFHKVCYVKSFREILATMSQTGTSIICHSICVKLT
jgi:hypothetical protein